MSHISRSIVSYAASVLPTMGSCECVGRLDLGKREILEEEEDEDDKTEERSSTVTAELWKMG